MTRVVAGTAGGRTLRTPPGSGTRPTSERVREALFSALDARGAVRGARVLDLYAGSGALGLEAASRGARSVTCVESDRRAAQVVLGNVRALGLSAVAVERRAVAGFLAGGAGLGRGYDLVLLDPPYDVGEEELADALAQLADRWLSADAVVVVERSARSPEPRWPAGLARTGRPRRYGETTLWWAEPTSEDADVEGALPPAPASEAADRMASMSTYEIPRPTSGDVIELILDDHRLFEHLLREARRTDSDRGAARQALAEVLVAHAESEEEEVYPTLRRAADGVTEHEAEHGEEEHAEIIEALLAFLQVDDTTGEDYDEALEEVATVVNHHSNEEEQTILNPAREEVDAQTRERLGAAWAARRAELLDEGCASVEQVSALLRASVDDGTLAPEGAREAAETVKAAAKETAEAIEDAATNDG